MRWNLPNILTWLRIVAIPLVVLLFYMPNSWADPAAGLLFAAASITDSLDGYLARRMGLTSRLGAFLDPVADKLIVAVTLVLLVSKNPHWVVVISAAVIIGREIAISALREWMARLGQSAKVSVSFVGKLKTSSQMIAILMLLWHDPVLGWNGTLIIGRWLLYLAALLTLWSMFHYLFAAWRTLKDQPAS